MASAVHAWFAWMAVESALRRHRPLPAPALLPWLAASLVATGVLVLFGVLTS